MTHVSNKNFENIKKFLIKIDNGNPFFLGLSGGVDSTTLAKLVREVVGKDRLHTFTIVDKNIDKSATDYANDFSNEVSSKHTIIKMSEIYAKSLLYGAGLEQDQGYIYLLGQAITLINNEHCRTHQTLTSVNYCETAVELSNFGTFMGEFSPIAHFLKSEIYSLADLFNVDMEVIDRVPGAGIVGGSDDAQIIGVTYNQLERYLMNVTIKDQGKKDFALVYHLPREDVCKVTGVTKKQLKRLEFRILDSARFWIREGPRPHRITHTVQLEGIDSDVVCGKIFRPDSYTFTQDTGFSNFASFCGKHTESKSNPFINDLGFSTFNDEKFDLDETRSDIELSVHARKIVKKLVLVRKKDKVSIVEHGPEGIKVLYITSGKIRHHKSYGC